MRTSSWGAGPCVALSLTLLTAACAGETARVRFAAPGTKTASVLIDGSKPLRLWADLDVSYEGAVALRFSIAFAPQGADPVRVVCDPLDVSATLGALESHLGDGHHVSHFGRMRCEPGRGLSGQTTLTAALSVAPNGAAELEQADLVLRQ